MRERESRERWRAYISPPHHTEHLPSVPSTVGQKCRPPAGYQMPMATPGHVCGPIAHNPTSVDDTAMQPTGAPEPAAWRGEAQRGRGRASFVTAAAHWAWWVAVLLVAAGQTTLAQDVCGRLANGTVCPAGACCSATGTCGVTEPFCSVGQGCQSNCWSCGDGVCRGAGQVAGETCGTCPQDCGPCTITTATVNSLQRSCVDPAAYTLAFDAPVARWVPLAAPHQPPTPTAPRDGPRLDRRPPPPPCCVTRVMICAVPGPCWMH